MKKRHYLLFFLIFLFVTYRTVYGEGVTVVFNRNSLHESKVYIYLSLQGDISFDTIDAIRNGITAKFFILFQLTKKGKGLFGSGHSTLKEKTETFTISYDIWENNFLIRDIGRDMTYYVPRADEILRKIEEVINPFSEPIDSIKPNDKLFVRAKIKIQTIKLYPPFGIFLIFFDPWNYEGEWVRSEAFTLNELE